MENKRSIHKTLCIVLINYRNDHDTISCLRSIYESENIEMPFVIIVDNSGEKSNLDKHIKFYTESKILYTGRNLGFAEGNNFGVRWAMSAMTFDYLFILNNDTILLKDTLNKLLCHAAKDPSNSVLTPCIITDDDPAKIWYAGGRLNYSRMTPVINNIEMDHRSVRLTSGLTAYASGCAILISVKDFDLNEELFDPYFFMYDEDVDFSLRMKKTGKFIFFLSDSIVIHKLQGSQNKGHNRVINQLSPNHPGLLFYLSNTINNRYYIINKYFNGQERINLIIRVSLYWLLKSIQFLLSLNFRAFKIVVNEIAGYRLRNYEKNNPKIKSQGKKFPG